MTAPAPVHPFDFDTFSDFSRGSRWILTVAAAQAHMARHPLAGSGHIVLATWLSTTTPAAHALREAGISGRVAKAWLNHEVRPTSRSDEPDFDWVLIARARAIAAEHGAEAVSPEHLLRAATVDPESDGVRMVRSQGVSPDRLHSLIETMLAAPPAPAIVERLTETAQAVIVSAGAHARELWHAEVGTGHVLLGLLDTPSDVQAELNRHRITFRAALVAFHEIVGVGEGGPMDHVPFTDEMDTVLAVAAKLAPARIAPRHLLAALLHHTGGDHHDIIRALGANPADLLLSLQPDSLRPGEATSGAVGPGRAITGPSRNDTADAPARRPRTERLRPARPGRRSTGGWRPEILLVGLALLSVTGGEHPNVWTRLGYTACAVGAIAVGSGAYLRAWMRKGPWRPIRMISAIALMLGSAALLLGRAFA